MERLIFAAAFLVLIISLVFVAALFISEKTELVPVAGGEYREGVLGQPTFVNPILVNGNDADRDLVKILFRSLTDLAETIKPNDIAKEEFVFIKNIPAGWRRREAKNSSAAKNLQNSLMWAGGDSNSQELALTAT